MRLTALTVPALLALCLAAAPASAEPGPWIDPGQIAISPDGQNLYATGYRTLSFRRDVATGELTGIDELGPPGGTIAIAPDGGRVFVGFRQQGAVGAAIHILSRDPASGLLTHESTFVEDPASHIAPGQVTDLAVSPDGRFLYVTQESESAVLVLAIDPGSGELRLEQAIYGGPDGQRGLDFPEELSLAPDGSSLYVAANAPLSYARDATTGHLTPLPAPAGYSGYQALRIAASPDGKRVYAGIGKFMVYDRDPATGQLTEVGPVKDGDTGCTNCGEAGPLAISPDSGSILQVLSRDNQLFQSAATDGGAQTTGVLTDFPGASDGDGLTWSPDGRFVYVSGGDRLKPGWTSNLAYGGTIAVLRREGSGLVSAGSVNPTPPAPDWAKTAGVSIDDGAIYTNDPHVKLRVTVPGWTPASFRVANEPSFDGVRPTRVSAPSATYDWLLDLRPGPPRSVKHVWLRFTGNGLYPDTVVSDDIILDQTPPQVVSAALARAGGNSKLTLRAKDNRSGVRQVQVTKNRSKPGKPRRFAKQVLVSGAPRVVYVRVADGAGNESRWRRVKR